MSTPIRFFLPGPTYVADDVRQAMTEGDIGHRSAAYKELHADIAPRLSELFRTSRDVVPISGSATLAMEMAITSLVRRDVLNLVCGAFSARWAKICRALGREADQVTVPWGHSIDPDLVRQALQRKNYEAVTVVHNETSTGVLNPLAEISQVIHEESEALVLVDTVSSMGGARIETDDWQLDYVLTGSQKALALPPGLAFMSPSERALKRAEQIPHRGFYTDMLAWLDKHRANVALTTPPIPQIRALKVGLDRIPEEGLEGRWQRHLALRQQTEAWASERGFTYASQAAAASPMVSCLKPPTGIDAPRLVADLAAAGYVVGGGYGDWKPTTLRIGHMGEVRPADLEGLFATIDPLLAQGQS
jgi:aspartate aminotransferase-like enzyme